MNKVRVRATFGIPFSRACRSCTNILDTLLFGWLERIEASEGALHSNVIGCSVTDAAAIKGLGDRWRDDDGLRFSRPWPRRVTSAALSLSLGKTECSLSHRDVVLKARDYFPGFLEGNRKRARARATSL